MTVPKKSCGFTHVRPVGGLPGKYMCSVCCERLRDSFEYELTSAMRKEVASRPSLPLSEVAPQSQS